MNDLMNLFHNLTPSTLAAIVADLDGNDDMSMTWYRAMLAGQDNCDDDFWPLLDEARAKRDGNDRRAEDLSGNNGPVAAILARQS